MKQMPEHREYPRMAVDCGIAWRRSGVADARTGIARNISGNGVLFVVDEQPAVGERMEITLSPGVLSIPALSALVEVVRVERDPEPVMGRDVAGISTWRIGARIVAMR